MKNDSLISKSIDEFYSKTSEENRLTLGLGPLEFERNCELIQRYLPKKNLNIADVGGGPGIYAEWLTGLGHHVTLIDPVEKHIRQAKKRASQFKSPFKAILGEARHISLPDDSMDLAILHGPLYHLPERADRLAAITEAKRITRPGGCILGFAINFTASALTGLLNGMIHQPEFYTMCQTELTIGLHQPPEGWPGVLPEAFFHKPEALRAEFAEAGLSGFDIIAVEGMIWLDGKYFETRSDPARKSAMMHLLKLTEKEPSALALSPHMMIAGRK